MNQQQLIEQKAKELLIQNCGTPTIGDNGEMTADLDYYIESDAALSTMIEFGEWMQGEVERQWISVKDRLPEPYQDVLGWIAYKEEIRSVYHTGSAWLNDDLGTPTVTHWMPEPHKPQTEHE